MHRVGAATPRSSLWVHVHGRQHSPRPTAARASPRKRDNRFPGTRPASCSARWSSGLPTSSFSSISMWVASLEPPPRPAPMGSSWQVGSHTWKGACCMEGPVCPLAEVVPGSPGTGRPLWERCSSPSGRPPSSTAPACPPKEWDRGCSISWYPSLRRHRVQPQVHLCKREDDHGPNLRLRAPVRSATFVRSKRRTMPTFLDPRNHPTSSRAIDKPEEVARRARWT